MQSVCLVALTTTQFLLLGWMLVFAKIVTQFSSVTILLNILYKILKMQCFLMCTRKQIKHEMN